MFLKSPTLSITRLLGTLLLCLAPFANADTGALAPGDEIRVDVVGQEELSTSGIVSQAGLFSMPLLGEVDVGGLATTSAAYRISQALQTRGFVRGAIVNISVLNESPRNAGYVTVLGEVSKSGRFPIITATTAGVRTFTDALAEAGGPTATAADHAFVLMAGEESPTRIDMGNLLQRGDLSGNVVLTAGATVIIPSMDTFFVYGEVERPGRYRLERGMTIEQAISIASGLTARGTAKNMQASRRQANGKVKKYRVQLEDPINPGDVLYVREGLF